MNLSVQTQLREIGLQLDADVYPHLFNDGVVAPAGSVIDVQFVGAENDHESGSTYRSTTGSRQRATGWQGQTGKSRASDPPASPGCERLQSHYLEQLDEIVAVYPQTTFWFQSNGLWLWVEGAVLPGLTRRATFLIAVPYSRGMKVKAWAFWSTALGHQWIGPRHTNAIDGSICAFNPADGTWKEGGNLTRLIDLYTLWVFRQLHAEVEGWWPGRQTAQYAFERLSECNDNEWCGCRFDAPRYGECCKQTDCEADRFTIAMEFIGGFLKFKPRRPPAAIVSVLANGSSPPEILRYKYSEALIATSHHRPVRILI